MVKQIHLFWVFIQWERKNLPIWKQTLILLVKYGWKGYCDERNIVKRKGVYRIKEVVWWLKKKIRQRKKYYKNKIEQHKSEKCRAREQEIIQ